MFLENIKSLPIEAVAEKLGIEVSKHKCRCPFHDDKHPSMSFCPNKNTWHCFVCGIGGNGIALVMKHENLDFREACNWLSNEFGYDSFSAPRHTRRKPASISIKPSSPKVENKSYIPSSFVRKSKSTNSMFCKSLIQNGILTDEQMRHAAERYHLGATKRGDVIFWQIDNEGKVREGKIMTYLPNCHRDHNHQPYTISYVLKKRKELPSTWTASPCLFGQHLLSVSNDIRVHAPQIHEDPRSADSKSLLTSRSLSSSSSSSRSLSSLRSSSSLILAIVESEKTAIILSELFPTLPFSSKDDGERGTRIIWLATGGLNNLSVESLKNLVLSSSSSSSSLRSPSSSSLSSSYPSGSSFLLFPDTDPDGSTYRKWKSIADAAQKALGIPFPVSNLLERCATADQKFRKIDLADFILENTS